MDTWVRLLIALVVFCHGFIYVRIGAVLPGPIAGWSGHSRLLGTSLTETQLLGRVVIPAHVTAGVLFIACAVAIAFVPASPVWWRSLAVVAALAGIAGFAMFWDGQVELLAQEGVIGAIVSALALVAAVAF